MINWRTDALMTSLTLFPYYIKQIAASVQKLITVEVICGKNISDTLGYRLLQHFDVTCNQLLNRHTATSVRLVDQFSHVRWVVTDRTVTNAPRIHFALQTPGPLSLLLLVG